MVGVWWELRNDRNWVAAEQDVKDIGVLRWAFYRRAPIIFFDVYEFYFTNTKGWNFTFELAAGNDSDTDSFHCFTLRNGNHCVDFDNGRIPPAIAGVI